MKKIVKAILPAAGLGTRFLPATKASPKEMLPIVDKPMIQYAVEESEKCGIEQFVIITGKNKRAIEDHFDVALELEENLKEKGKKKLLDEINSLKHLEFAYIRQGRALGLAHAIMCARPFIKEEPVAVLLSDDIIDPEETLLQDMMEVYYKYESPVIALERVPKDEIHRYGVISGKEETKGVYKIDSLVEKPPADEAPSDLAIIGRYILTPDIFNIFEKMSPGKGGEYQLTDALNMMIKNSPIYGFVFEGRRYDAGDKLGFLKATVELALRSDQLSDSFRDFLKKMAADIK
ncbi:MAG: UTP--glucose-1-phosphate uridylyltransferase GalU [Nitrospirota bacterium]|nr:MAG: UTP--glucose-1-phosphate uridylyltransferase GalU [Nitrospirota bacterium]